MDLFGFSILKPQQQEVIDAVLADKDCLAVMPNGGGKSACYVLERYIEVDVVKEVRDIVESIWICLNTSITVNYVVDVFRTDKKRELYPDDNLILTQCAMYGKGNGWSKKNALKLIHKLILDDVLQEQLIFREGLKPFCKLHVGKNWQIRKYNFIMHQKDSKTISKKFKIGASEDIQLLE
ncbi:hypothetical protein DAPPUDRAFT_330365 [Daphnia pulex]|uniref:RQC domain-containing protein n=1 Tax=Daphnia pulex TaxID=6669 RepID=E9HJD1_DAPPU|nr:hypothetical protein DAPPUDRAFT_330365 [Daphnia pulex]|eukprot:EFX68166.1 hypothetical protein DAPPUDRAFT_330365 [Daphnia pulex]